MSNINQQGNYMVKYDLDRLQANTGRLQSMGGGLPEWAKSKLTEARSHVANVANYQQSHLGLTNQEAAVIQQVSGQLNKASQMHKGQAERLRNLGSSNNAPPGYHYMPDGTLMANSAHLAGHCMAGHCTTMGGSNSECCLVCKRCDGCVCPSNNNLRGTLGNVSGRTAGTVLGAALIGNTILAKNLEKMSWWKALDLGFTTVGLGTVLAGAFTVSKGMKRDDIGLLAAGGALTGMGSFYLLAGE